MEHIRSYPLDHHGLVASICDELNIVERINQLIGSDDSRHVVQPGTAIKAMIINGLGFSSRTLYLTPQFFSSKPVELLLGEGIKAEYLDDHTLGKALDEIYEYGPTKFFAQVAFGIARDHGLLGNSAHLDSTSFSVQGMYDFSTDDVLDESISTAASQSSTLVAKSDSSDEKTENKEKPLNITYGYSKDKRPDLKQVMLSMVMSGSANLPIWVEGQDGNSSDKAHFHQTIKAVQAFREQLDTDSSFMWIADSALYSEESILGIQDYIWVTRVPETLTECRKVLNEIQEDSVWTDLGNGYKIYQTHSNYGGIPQRWFVVFSQQAYEREMHTLEKSIDKEKENAIKACSRLKKKIFTCSNDANEYAKELTQKYKYHTIETEVVEVLKHTQKGRPKKNEMGNSIGYRIEAKPVININKKNEAVNRKGKFILATNELDEQRLSSEMILSNYKEQQSVERGFRFLKDPYFMADTFFLKKPERIEALMVVMCLCLLVYNFGQYHMRKELNEQNESLPNQKNKEIKNPTLRWIFQIMEGVALIQVFDNSINDWKSYVTNLNPLRIKIIRLFGQRTKNIYKIE